MVFLLVSAGQVMLSAQEMSAERKLALQTPKVYFNPGEAEYSGTRRMFQGIPGIEYASNGRLWAACFSGGTGEGGPNNYVLLTTSDDDGRTWSGLKVVVDMPGPVRTAEPCLWIDPLGRMWFFWCQAYSPWIHCGVWAIVTENPEDADPVWSEPRRLCEGVMLNKPIVLSTGEWLFPVDLKHWNSEYKGEPNTILPPDIMSAPELFAVILTTNDQGKTFTLRGKVDILDPADRHASHLMIVEKEDGTLWMHVKIHYGMGESISYDKGRTWSPVEPSSIKNTFSRSFIGKLNSGNLLMVKNGPIDKKTARELMTAFVSTDNGNTWSNGLILDERHPVSYPDGIQAPNGRIYVIYDHGRYPGTAREILMAVFTEEDVLAGKPSEDTRLKVVINRALEPLCTTAN